MKSLNVDGVLFGKAFEYAGLVELLATTELFYYTGLFKFSLEFFEGAFNVFAFLNGYYNHFCVLNLFLLIFSCFAMYKGKYYFSTRKAFEK